MIWIHSTKLRKPCGEIGTLVGGVTVMQEGAAPQSGRQSKTLFLATPGPGTQIKHPPPTSFSMEHLHFGRAELSLQIQVAAFLIYKAREYNFCC